MTKAMWWIGLVATVASACGSGAQNPDGRITVVASFYPLYEAAARVGGDAAGVTNLTPPAAEPHDIELDPGDIVALQEADLVVYLGSGFQPALEEALMSRSGPSLDVASIGGGGADPHVWLDPTLMKRIADSVAAKLGEIDAANAQRYTERAAAYGVELGRLHADFDRTLRSCKQRTLVTSHAAFGYLAERYNLEQEPIAGISPEAEPGPQRLTELRDLVRREGVTTIFTETLVSARVAETLARDAGVRVAVLNPIEGLTADEQRAGATYLTEMRENLATLAQALDCAG